MKPTPSAAAFTLTELLVSFAILSIILLAAATCLQLSLRATTHSRRQADHHRHVRDATRVLLNDFRHAVINADTPLFLNPPPEIIQMPSPPPPADSVFFFTNHPAFGSGELCAVGYYLNTSRQLLRYFKNNGATWQSLSGGFLPHALDPATPLFPAVAAQNEPLLAGVRAFRIRALRADASAMTESPLTARPALLEISLNFQEGNLTHEFTVSVPGR
ncbi:MAG: prepilin-type N-terminal cleavage/methylation domain-containing protein [Verrucomicrobiales bacterium]|jgi:type II secretory pathway pseudopilin PulG|nr:prepilin-type N-terminal cleavage/methylation domain-containing protein [Verrucomicrobiales bacterium]